MTEILLAASGWFVAALFAGLWWGERGRRKDLAWLVNKDRGSQAATVEDGDDPVIRAGEEAAAVDREKLIEMLTSEGASLEQAKDEADRMISHVHGITASGW